MDSQVSLNAVGVDTPVHKHGKYIAVFVLVLIAGAVCWHIHRPPEPLTPKPGTLCTVQFRRGDALGSADGLPVSPTIDVINGAKVSLTGTWIAESADAILLSYPNESTPSRIWIPKSNILLIQYDSHTKSK